MSVVAHNQSQGCLSRLNTSVSIKSLLAVRQLHPRGRQWKVQIDESSSVMKASLVFYICHKITHMPHWGGACNMTLKYCFHYSDENGVILQILLLPDFFSGIIKSMYLTSDMYIEKNIPDFA